MSPFCFLVAFYFSGGTQKGVPRRVSAAGQTVNDVWDELRVALFSTSVFPCQQNLLAYHVDFAIDTPRIGMMASTMRPLKTLTHLRAVRPCLREIFPPRQSRSLLTTTTTTTTRLPSPLTSEAAVGSAAALQCRRSLHTSLPLRKRAHNDEEVPDGPPTTDFSRMDMLASAPVPSTSVDICSSDGFKLNSGVSIYDGKGLLLVGGEAFEWQPWGPDMRLVNKKGQWEVPEGAFGLLDLLWPRPGT